MKTKCFIATITCLLFVLITNGQDSIRTRNDKPGTPQSLRTVNNAPRNKVHLIDTYKPLQQEIYHGATESNKVGNLNNRATAYPAMTNANRLPSTPAITIDNRSINQTIRRDTAVNKGTMGNGESNATNPIRK